MTQRPIYKSQTVDAIEVHMSLGSYQENGPLDVVSSRLIALSIPPQSSYEEFEAQLLSMVRVALKHCQAEAFPHG